MRLVPFWQKLFGDVKPFDWLMWATEMAVLVLIAYEIWIKEVLTARARRRALSKTFRLSLERQNYECQRPFLLGVLATVHIGHPVELRRFGFRFVSGRDGGNIPDDVIPIVGIESIRNPNPTSLRSWGDEKGGIYAEWMPAPHYTTGEALHFKLAVNPSCSWSGFLSFKAYDADDQVQYSRQEFAVEVKEKKKR